MNIKRLYLKTFSAAFVIFLLSVLPVVISSGGKYYWFGDYETQIAVFREHMCRQWKNGLPLYDLTSELGMNFIGGYLFYGLCSPFTLLSLIIPENALPYAMTAVNALKSAVSALGGCIYSKEYVKKDSSAFCCGLMYAFSGPMIFNMVFHFSDATALFPFLLYAFDKLAGEGKKGAFAILLAVAGFTNYYFLWGECVFILIYYIIKAIHKDFPFTIKRFLYIAAESALGLGMTGAALLPAFYMLQNTPRAHGSIFEHNLLAYSGQGTVLKIIQSIFMPPDTCANGTLFSDGQTDVASVSLYIPLFLIVGVWVVLKKNREKWYGRLLAVCGIMACVPLFNSFFSMFNSRYYARWFFMPLLVMIMLTGKFLDDFNEYDTIKELKITCIVLGVIAVCGIEAALSGQMGGSIPVQIKSSYFIQGIISSLAGCGILYAARYRKELPSLRCENFGKILSVFCIVPALTMGLLILSNYPNYGESYAARETSISPLKEEDEEFFRVSTLLNDNSNANLRWGVPSVDMFHSLVSKSSTDFWSLCGVERDSSGNFKCEDYAAYTFLSVKYDLYYNKPLRGGIIVEPEDVPLKKTGSVLYDVQDNYLVFKNENFIPMGFTYDHYININEFVPLETDKNDNEEEVQTFGKGLNSVDKQPDYAAYRKLLLKGIWLTDEQAEKYSDILEELPVSLKEDVSDEAYIHDCEERRKSAALTFIPQKDGFVSDVSLPRDNLVFYSVPYDEGFSAYVDGEKTEIEKVFGGLCAVKVPAGEHTVKFVYTVPGLKAGIIITVFSVTALAAMIIITGIAGKKKEKST